MKVCHHMLSFIERVLTAANARCSHMGCNRRRHAGECNVEHHDHAAPVAVKPAAAPSAPITLARIRLVKRPARSIAA